MPLTTVTDPHRLQVYGLALEFNQRAEALRPSCRGAVRDQLARAGLSIVLNIAEGAGRFSAGEKARFYGIARGSACECVAVLDVLGIGEGVERQLLARIVAMLTGLIASMKRRRAVA
jgi:four helix bundle protein